MADKLEVGWVPVFPQSPPQACVTAPPGSPQHLPSTPEAWTSSRCPTPTFRLVNAGPRTRKKQTRSFSSTKAKGSGLCDDLIPGVEPHGDQTRTRLDFQTSPPWNLGPRTTSSAPWAQRKGNLRCLGTLPITMPSGDWAQQWEL